MLVNCESAPSISPLSSNSEISLRCRSSTTPSSNCRDNRDNVGVESTLIKSGRSCASSNFPTNFTPAPSVSAINRLARVFSTPLRSPTVLIASLSWSLSAVSPSAARAIARSKRASRSPEPSARMRFERKSSVRRTRSRLVPSPGRWRASRNAFDPDVIDRSPAKRRGSSISEILSSRAAFLSVEMSARNRCSSSSQTTPLNLSVYSSQSLTTSCRVIVTSCPSASPSSSVSLSYGSVEKKFNGPLNVTQVCSSR
jgi:hypothetical protein